MKKCFLLLTVLTLCLAFCACAEQPPAVEASSIPEFSSSEEEKQPIVLEGKNPVDVDLDATLPDGVRLIDPNFAPPEEHQTDTVCNVFTGMQYSIRIFVYDIELTYNEFDVLNVNAFKWQDGAPDEYQYQLMTLDGAEGNPKTYAEIEPYIIYKDDNRIVIETSELLGLDTWADMEKYIEKEKDVEKTFLPFIDDRKTYDYSWIKGAFDLVIENKDRLIVPIEE